MFVTGVSQTNERVRFDLWPWPTYKSKYQLHTFRPQWIFIWSLIRIGCLVWLKAYLF